MRGLWDGSAEVDGIAELDEGGQRELLLFLFLSFFLFSLVSLRS